MKQYKSFNEIRHDFKDESNHCDIATFVMSVLAERKWITLSCEDFGCTEDELDTFALDYGFKCCWKAYASVAGTTEYRKAIAHPLEDSFKSRKVSHHAQNV